MVNSVSRTAGFQPVACDPAKTPSASPLTKHLKAASNSNVALQSVPGANLGRTSTLADAQKWLYRTHCTAIFGAKTQSLLTLAYGNHGFRGHDARLLLDLGLQLRLLATHDQPLSLEQAQLATLGAQLLDDKHGKISIATMSLGNSTPHEQAVEIRNVLDKLIAADPSLAFAKVDAALKPLLADGLVKGLENQIGATLTQGSRQAVIANGHASTVGSAMVAQQTAKTQERGDSTGMRDNIVARLSPLELHRSVKPPAVPPRPKHSVPKVSPQSPVLPSGNNRNIQYGAPINNTQTVELGGLAEVANSIAKALETLTEVVNPIVKQNERLLELLVSGTNKSAGARDLIDRSPRIRWQTEPKYEVAPAFTSRKRDNPEPAQTQRVEMPFKLREADSSRLRKTTSPHESVIPRPPLDTEPAISDLPNLRYTFVRQNAAQLPPTLMPATLKTDLKVLWNGVAASIQTSAVHSQLDVLKEEIKQGWYPTAQGAAEVDADGPRGKRMQNLYLDLINTQPLLAGHISGILGLMSRAGLAQADARERLSAELMARIAALDATRARFE